MNILLLNWRDPKNPLAGGAEKLNLQIVKPLLEKGHKVIWYAQSVPGLPDKEIINGIKVIRFGNTFTHLFFWPLFFYAGKFGKVDLIIDSIHGTGYLTSLFVSKARKIILICEVAQNIWDEMIPYPINKIGKAWEKVMFWFYKKNKFWTISESTKNDLVNFGIHPKNISILPMGFDAIDLANKPLKYKNPTALFVGRLAEMKGIRDAIMAVAKINKYASSNKWTLRIVGRGKESYEKELKALVSKLNLDKEVIFLGYVGEKEKFKEMAKAWILLAPSSREGWGMIAPEANYMGTPAVGYDVPGSSEVLKKYSRSNLIIKKNYNNLAKTLKKINKPSKVEEAIAPGWSKLGTFISSEFE